jgi:hypothetical protein
MYDNNDIIIMDEDEDDEDLDYRNAIVVRGGREGRGGTRIARRPRPRSWMSPWGPQSGPPGPRPVAEVKEEKKERKASDWIPDVLRGMAALLPLPVPPSADPDVNKNIVNLLLYLGATGQVAGRKEQLYALASIAERHL